MPYKKRYKRRFRKSKTMIKYKSKIQQVGDVAIKGLAVALAVKKLLNVEHKEHDVQITTTAIPVTTGTITQLTNIAVGDTKVLRNGDNIKIESIHIKGLLLINASSANSHIRVMLVYDKQTNGAIYTLANLLEDVTISDSVVSALNTDNKYRFNILYDKIHTLNRESGAQSKTFEIFRKVNKPIRYSTAAGDITDLRSGSYSLVMLQDIVTNEPTTTVFARLIFIDN